MKNFGLCQTPNSNDLYCQRTIILLLTILRCFTKDSQNIMRTVFTPIDATARKELQEVSKNQKYITNKLTCCLLRNSMTNIYLNEKESLQNQDKISSLQEHLTKRP
ncbi:hypothetical protein AAHE18_16G059400 [Arachis hypogaea]